jgi:hypothetical protein
MGLLDQEHQIWVGQARSQKIQTFILITKTFPGFGMDMHPEVENDNGDADPLPIQKTILETNEQLLKRITTRTRCFPSSRENV